MELRVYDKHCEDDTIGHKYLLRKSMEIKRKKEHETALYYLSTLKLDLSIRKK